MNQCSLCMTENHEQATVCKACGAQMWVKHTLAP